MKGMRTRVVAGLAVSTVPVWLACAPQATPTRAEATAGFPVLSGPYLGQTPPGAEPVPFAPGIISTGLAELNSVFTPDGGEFYYSVDIGLDWVIMVSRQEEGVWSEPEVTPFTRGHSGVDLSISADGERLVYCSNRSRSGGEEVESNLDIWQVERTPSGAWSEPVNLSAVNSDGSEFYPTLTAEGTLYFLSSREGGLGGSDLYRSALVDGRYAEPVNVGPPINTAANEGDTFVAPDESFLILNSQSRVSGPGDGSLLISFRGEDGSWSEPRNLGQVMKADRSDFCPMLSPDGRFFFFSSARPRLRDRAGRITWAGLLAAQARPENGNTDLYWVDAGFIDDLRP